MNNQRLKILHVLPGGAYFGGTERYLYNYYQHMDREAIHFDFVFGISNSMKIVREKEVFQDSVFLELCTIKEEGNGFSDWIAFTKSLRKLLRSKQYDIVEIQTASIFILFFSALGMIGTGVKKIAHTHSMHQKKGGIIGEVIFAIERWVINHSYDSFFSCSKAAGVALYGEKTVQSSHFHVIPNAIDTKAFRFDKTRRKEIRAQCGIDDQTLIIGHVARLSAEKNQLFLIDVFAEIKKKYEKAVLWIIGDGDYREQINAKIVQAELKDSIQMFGQIEDIKQYLHAMDAFIIPSFREGLCISAIESQANGIPTFVSDSIPEECNISANFHCISLQKCASDWASEILKVIDNKPRKEGHALNTDYDIIDNSKSLQQIYIDMT